jgi:hypothetical protein
MLLCGVGCHRESQHAPHRAPVEIGRISLASIEPKPGTVLVPGSRVKVVAVVDYDLTAEGNGAVSLVIQDEKMRSLIPEAGPSVSIHHGHGTAELRYDLMIPQGRHKVVIYLPLLSAAAQVGDSTSAVATQEYAVKER